MRVVIEKDSISHLNNKGLDDFKFMQMFLFQCISEIKQYMASGIFRHPTGALMNSVNGYVIGDYVVIYSDKRYASAQEFGVKPHSMWYLIGKTVPIKIFNTFGGPPTTIFRRVTFTALANGKWRHPGYPGKYYMKTGINMAVKKAMDLKIKMISGGNVFL